MARQAPVDESDVAREVQSVEDDSDGGSGTNEPRKSRESVGARTLYLLLIETYLPGKRTGSDHATAAEVLRRYRHRQAALPRWTRGS
jgi:hypothetical protein